MKRILLFSGLSFLMLVSCNNAKLENPFKHSGEELFRGIFLLEGEVSEKMPSQFAIMSEIKKIIKQRPEFENEFREKNSELVESVRNLDNSYFALLKNAVESGNVTTLENAIARGNTLISIVILPKFYKNKNVEIVQEIVSSVDINKFDITSEEGLTNYFITIQEKIKHIPKSVDLQRIQNGVVGRCLTVWAVVAAVVWDVVAVINYGLLINVGAAINVVAAVNTANAVNTTEHTNDVRWGIPGRPQSSFGNEKRIQEIFNLAR